MIKEITSTKNQTYKFIKSLKNKKTRVKSGVFTVEGIKSVNDAINAKMDISFIAISDKLDIEFEAKEVYRVSDNIFSALCDTDSPQGVIAVINTPKKKEISLDEKLYLYCDHVSDPGNMGTIIRICDAVGCSLMLSPECADIYSPKTVRSSMGSFFHTKIIENVTYQELLELKNQKFSLFAGALNENTVDFCDDIYGEKNIIIVGNEANGVSEELLSLCDRCVKIPIYGNAESLNVAIAAALLLYKVKEKQEF